MRDKIDESQYKHVPNVGENFDTLYNGAKVAYRRLDMSSSKPEVERDEFTSTPEEVNMVDHPPHYNSGKYETIDVIEDVANGYKNGFVAYCVSNVIKYIYRAPFKGSFLQDLKKASFYLNRVISYIEEKGIDEKG